METSADKHWATKYLLDPLTAPEPSDETGPGSHFVRHPSTFKTPKTTTPSRDSKKARSTSTSPSTSAIYPTPPNSASPTKSSFHPKNPYAASSHRQSAFGDHKNTPSKPPSSAKPDTGKGRRRNSSLSERYPGDMSHRPLDQLRKEAKAADRSPHLKKQHLPGADTIDSLDRTMFGMAYHHEGPYDATLLARNRNYKNSPVEATRGTNEEALRATPRERIQDSLTKHVPLQGTAVIPPGFEGIDGQVMRYKEGADLMREEDAPGGAYKRYEGIKYLPEDLKGKGEPSYSIEKALKDHEKSKHRRIVSDVGSNNNNLYEMQPDANRHLRPGANRMRSVSGDDVNVDRVGPSKPAGGAMRYANLDSDIKRSNSTGARIGEGLKKRFGSLRRSKKVAGTES